MLETATGARRSFIKATEGNIVDYEQIRADLNADGDRFAIQELAYDPWNATQLATQLQADGFTVVLFRQGYASPSEPTKAFEKLLFGRGVNHAEPISA